MIVDVQQGMFALRRPLHRGDEIVQRIAALLERARSSGTSVVHVQHDGGPGHVLAKGSAGFPSHPLVAPQVSHLRQVPLRINVKLPHSSQLSPS